MENDLENPETINSGQQEQYTALRTPNSIFDKTQSSSLTLSPDRARLVDNYYRHFHPHHSILVPRKFYDEKLVQSSSAQQSP